MDFMKAIDAMNGNNDKIHAISFQSLDVWDIIKRDGVFYCNPEKVREKSNHKEDIEVFGHNPVWMFDITGVNTDDILSCKKLDYFANEMGYSIEEFNNFIMLELWITAFKPLSTRHYVPSRAMVASCFTAGDVVGVYDVIDSGHYFYKIFKPIYTTDKSMLKTVLN